MTDDIATIRSALLRWGTQAAALDRVAARLAEVELGLRTEIERYGHLHNDYRAMVARAKQAEQERNEEFHNSVDAGERAMFAEARARALTEALVHARENMIAINAAGFDSSRGNATLHGIKDIDDVLAADTKEPV